MQTFFSRSACVILLSVWLLSGKGVQAFYTEIYDHQVESFWEDKPTIEGIDDKTGEKGEKLSQEAKDYVFVCPEVRYSREELEQFWYDQVPDRHAFGEETIAFSHFFSGESGVRDCIDPQRRFYQTQKSLTALSERLEEKANEDLDDLWLEDIDPQGDDYDFFESLRRHIITLHGEAISDEIEDFLYLEEEEEDEDSESAEKEPSDEIPQALYGEGRPLEVGTEREKEAHLETPGHDKGTEGVMALLGDTTTVLQELNKTPKKAQQVSLLAFESGLAASGKYLGQHLSKPFFFLEYVPDITHHSLFEKDQYDYDLWEEVEGGIEKILEQEPCTTLVEARLKGKTMNISGETNLSNRCEKFQGALFDKQLREQTRASRMKRHFMEAEYLGKQLERDLTQYKHLQTMVEIWKNTTQHMASKRYISGEPRWWQHVWDRISKSTAKANEEEGQSDKEDHYKCEQDEFRVMTKLLEEARKDLNRVKAKARSAQGEDFEEDPQEHSVKYNRIMADDYQIYTHYQKWLRFPESLRQLFNDYYKEVGDMDRQVFQISKDMGKKREADEMVTFHLSVIDQLMPSLLLPARINIHSTDHDIQEFKTAFETRLEAKLSDFKLEFDWGRLRYCADIDLFETFDRKPEDIQKELLLRPDTFSGYTNARISDIFTQKEDREKRRAPSVGAFNPETFCTAQERKEDQERITGESEGYFDLVRDFFSKILSFFQSDEDPKGREAEGYGEISEMLQNEAAKEASRERKREHQSKLSCQTQYYKKMYEWDQFAFEREQERFEKVLRPIINDMDHIIDAMKLVCKKQHSDLPCPLP